MATLDRAKRYTMLLCIYPLPTEFLWYQQPCMHGCVYIYTKLWSAQKGKGKAGQSIFCGLARGNPDHGLSY